MNTNKTNTQPRVPLGMIEDKDGILIAWCADGTIWIWSMNTKNWVPFDSIPPRKEEDLK